MNRMIRYRIAFASEQIAMNRILIRRMKREIEKLEALWRSK